MYARIIVLFVLLLASCSEAPEPDKKVARLYVDLLKAEETFYTGLDSLQFVRDSLFNFYNISEENYKSQIRIYAEDSKTWRKFYEMSMSYIDSLATKTDR